MESTPIHSSIDGELPQDAAFSRRGCCCGLRCMNCNRLTFSVGSNWWQGITEDGKADDHRGWAKGLLPFKKIKEWTDLVAGSKLKTFIRRFNKTRSKHGKFQYDPTSYLLNFDDGPGQLEDDDRLLRNFSTRYSSILVSREIFDGFRRGWAGVHVTSNRGRSSMGALTCAGRQVRCRLTSDGRLTES